MRSVRVIGTALFLAFVADIKTFCPTGAVLALFKIKKTDGQYEVAELSIAIISRVELWRLLGDVMADTAKVGPAAIVRYGFNSAANKVHQLSVRFELIGFLFAVARFRFWLGQQNFCLLYTSRCV